MRVSVKARYALASMMYLVGNVKSDEFITVSAISKELGISKIYLEQVFSQLKKIGMMSSVKGAQGGYMAAKGSENLSIWEILSSVELLLFEKTEKTVTEQAIDDAMFSEIFDPMDVMVKDFLQNLTLKDLIEKAHSNMSDNAFMFYI